LDFYALLVSGVALETILGAGRAIYGSQFTPELTVRALTYFDDLQGPPLSEDQKKSLLRAAKAVRFARIPSIAGIRGIA
jgi:hypothetical protein